LCVELHHYLSGAREVYITTKDGTGVMFDACNLSSLQSMLKGLDGAEVKEGHIIYLTLDDTGKVRFEEGVQGAGS